MINTVCKCGTPFVFGPNGQIYRCRECRRKYDTKRRTLAPWIRGYESAQSRCLYKHDVMYKSYGAKGIKFLLTLEQTKELWIRDGASSMNEPSIDRLDSSGHYEFNNCQFIERKFNCSRKRTNKYNRKTIDDMWLRLRNGQAIPEIIKATGMDDSYVYAIFNGRMRPHEWEYEKGQYPADLYAAINARRKGSIR